MISILELPKADKSSFLQRCMVQTSVAKLGNLIMISLQMARANVRNTATLLIITVKLMWKSMKKPQARDIWAKQVFGNRSQEKFVYRFCLGYVNIIQAPHVDYERDVFNHDEAVCDRHASEDHVDGVPHVLVGEHQDVGNVEQGAQHAHQHGQPAVDWRIKFLKKSFIVLNVMISMLLSP